MAGRPLFTDPNEGSRIPNQYLRTTGNVSRPPRVHVKDGKMSDGSQNWVRNFGPKSTAPDLLKWLLANPEGGRIDAERLREKVLTYKEDRGLRQVDLMQLRDYVQFDANTVCLGDRASRKRIVHVTEQIMLQHGAII